MDSKSFLPAPNKAVFSRPALRRLDFEENRVCAATAGKNEGRAGLEIGLSSESIDAGAAESSSSSGEQGMPTGSRQSGFRTARGGEVSISEEALRRGSAILADIVERDERRYVCLLSQVLDDCVASSFYGIRNLMVSSGIPRHPVVVDEVVDLSRTSISSCGLSCVDGFSIRMQSSSRRLEKMVSIGSITAGDVVFDDFGDFGFQPDGMRLEILNRLSFCPLSEELKRWVSFQIRWIVWTLASFERRRPHIYLNQLLHKENVLTLLSSRYALYTGGRTLAEDAPPLKRFKANCGMSPLQRCCDIATLVWPLCVCIAMSGNECMITDGWWWSPCKLDGHLSTLVEKVNFLAVIQVILLRLV